MDETGYTWRAQPYPDSVSAWRVARYGPGSELPHTQWISSEDRQEMAKAAAAMATWAYGLALEEVAERFAKAVRERRMESRNVAARKVVELAADLGDILERLNPAFDRVVFYGFCNFGQDEMDLAENRNRV